MLKYGLRFSTWHAGALTPARLAICPRMRVLGAPSLKVEKQVLSDDSRLYTRQAVAVEY